MDKEIKSETWIWVVVQNPGANPQKNYTLIYRKERHSITFSSDFQTMLLLIIITRGSRDGPRQTSAVSGWIESQTSPR